MNKKYLRIFTPMAFLLTVSVTSADMSGKLDGKAEFIKHCASCHPDGGNIINPAKTIKKAELAKSGIKSTKDIVTKIRNPGPGMTKYSKQEMPDKEAKAIADYILKTFK